MNCNFNLNVILILFQNIVLQFDTGNIAQKKKNPHVPVNMDPYWQTAQWPVHIFPSYVSSDDGQEWWKCVVKPMLINKW